MTVVIGRQGGGTHEGLRRFLARAKKAVGLRGEVTVLLTTSSEMRTLNRKFRKKNQPTDVLSFPAAEGGDIAISTQIAKAQARQLGHSLDQELKVLLLHGLLHLSGHDHESDRGEMLRVEKRLRARLGLPDSLTERGLSPKTRVRSSRS
ncbi:MAG: rRNA maturation RNase YbeY [Acidobacteriales bacterium]|nr:rRNA maturation RNase YbeY [Terriglobales bacterium]